MRILFIYRHFWPDTPPYAAMLRSIAAHLAAAGHEVSIWCEMPTCGPTAPASPRCEILDGISVSRVKSLPFPRDWKAVRALGVILFPPRMLARAILHKCAGGRFDLVVSATIPPVINGVFALLAARLLGARFLYHCQDIYPELGSLTGLWKPGGWRARVLLRLDRWTCKGAWRVVVLGRDMRATLTVRGGEVARLSVLNNFMVQDFDAKEPHEAVAAQRFQVIFAGNVGRFQGLDAMLDAAEELQKCPEIEFLFLGNGSEAERLKRRSAWLSNVRFQGAVPIAQALPLIAAASLGIVSLRPGLISAAYPSKTLTYLGLGVPVLAIVERDCGLACMIEGDGVGYVAAPDDSAAIANTVRRAYENRRANEAMRARAKDLYARRFSENAALARWRELVLGSAGPA